MESKDLQSELMKFLKEVNPVERTDIQMSAMKVENGFSVQIVHKGKMLNFFVGTETHTYITSRVFE